VSSSLQSINHSLKPIDVSTGLKHLLALGSCQEIPFFSPTSTGGGPPATSCFLAFQPPKASLLHCRKGVLDEVHDG
jgi:hypothetical protein